tara:strand:+ start:1781 stop:2482 length:702 start_codon:yes stop_codon:yes gene_type:complete
MDNLKKRNFFLLIRSQQLILSALNENNEILFNRKILLDNLNLEESFEVLVKFLENNIFELEKKFDYYIKDINLVIDSKEFITIDVSSIYNFDNIENKIEGSLSNLSNIKDNVLKSMNDYDLIHMIINKFIIDKKEYSIMPIDSSYNNVFLEIRFICLKKNVTQKLQKIFSKYEIYIKNISYFSYVNLFKKHDTDDIFILADKLINGYNPKEVSFIQKPPENVGFFEKFFKLFN